MTEPTVSAHRQIWRENGLSEGIRVVPEETALAMSYGASTHAVMMGTPQDLEDFAVGFSLTEGIIDNVDGIESLEVVPQDEGIELRMWLSGTEAARQSERRRHIAGPTGCGLCGIDSIAEAMRPVALVGTGITVTPAQIMTAMQALYPLQKLNTLTRAVHAAAFWDPERGILECREDVGRHNALDKLAGALARNRIDGASGAVLLTSRVSVEMVQKTAVIGASLIVSVSAPTALAIRMAERAGITLCAIARSDGFEIFTYPNRVKTDDAAIHVA
ncbi:formate dehydrogenase accessory sulfurtransferase FdhD [Afipia carboxidovorans]|uniref:formate dehydrogenase accessory sulfurtransferase FdhD n=1 Tax=Afipia carboxidovorans TaxID=40137 RepID=UPI003084E894|nr:formate dehydrogenase accessory sulfurtransferase FdhD [Afipia carboxidovorans]